MNCLKNKLNITHCPSVALGACFSIYINKIIPAFIFPILCMDFIKTTRIDPVIIMRLVISS